jgi:CubicO group peptidase (beta-lactamase class C family)
MSQGHRTALFLFAALVLIVVHLFLLWRTGPACLFVSRDEPFARTRCRILRYMEGESIPSVAAAVAQNGTIIWAEALGFSDLESRLQAKADTPYRLGTGTSLLTTLAVERVAVERNIDLDEHLTLVPEFSRAPGLENGEIEVTLRQLLSHRGGFPHYWHHKPLGRETDSPSHDDTIRRYGFLATPPGRYLSISSVGLSVLAKDLETRTGVPIARLLRREGLEPLGLSTSGFLATSCDTGPLAQGYDEDGQKLPCYATAVPVFDGGIASIRDLARIGLERLKADSLDGEIWSRWDDLGFSSLGIDGHSRGATASLTLLPEEGIAVAILANRTEVDTGRIRHWILEETLPDYRRSQNRAKWMSPSDEADFAAPEMPPSVPGDWRGELACGPEILEARLLASDSQATFSYNGQPQGANTDRVFWTGDSLVVDRLSIPLPRPELEGHPHSVSLRLWWTEEALSGLALAVEESHLFAIPCQLALSRASD